MTENLLLVRTKAQKAGKILSTIIPKLVKAVDGEIDLGDLGSELGESLPELSKEQAMNFIRGIEHGISLKNGTH